MLFEEFLANTEKKDYEGTIFFIMVRLTIVLMSLASLLEFIY